MLQHTTRLLSMQTLAQTTVVCHYGQPAMHSDVPLWATCSAQWCATMSNLHWALHSGVPSEVYGQPETNIFTDYSLQKSTNIFAKCRLISLQSILISLRYNPCTIIFAPPPLPAISREIFLCLSLSLFSFSPVFYVFLFFFYLFFCKRKTQKYFSRRCGRGGG